MGHRAAGGPRSVNLPLTPPLSFHALARRRINQADHGERQAGQRRPQSPPEQQTSRLRLEEICSTILLPPAFQCWPAQKVEAEFWAVAKAFRVSSFPPHVLSPTPHCYFLRFIASLPDGTNAKFQKINLSHLDDNTFPQVTMLHHFENQAGSVVRFSARGGGAWQPGLQAFYVYCVIWDKNWCFYQFCVFMNLYCMK